MINLESTAADNVSTQDAASYRADILQVIKNEIINDPEKLGYAGKTAQEIADLMNKPTQVFIKNKPSLVDEAFAAMRQEFLVLPTDLFITKNGRVNDKYPEIQAVLDQKMQTKFDENKFALAETTLIDALPKMQVGEPIYEPGAPRWLKVIQGLYYTQNVVTAEDINEALK